MASVARRYLGGGCLPCLGSVLQPRVMEPLCSQRNALLRRTGAICALAALYALAAAGCGGAKAPPTDALPPQVAAPESATVQDETGPCPWDLPAVVAHLQDITFTILDQPSSFNQWTWQGATAEVMTIGFELRDARGRQAGTLEFHCDARGLTLASVMEETTRLAFAPPLPVLPVDGSPQVIEGSAVVAMGTRSDEFPFVFAVEALPTTAPVGLSQRMDVWTDVRSVLTIDVDGDPWIWESETRWGATSSPAALFPATRSQRQHRPGTTLEWGETASVIVPRRNGR